MPAIRNENPVLQQFIEELRALTSQINEFSNYWHNLTDKIPLDEVAKLPEKQKRQLIKAVSLFELACQTLLEKRK